MTPHITSAAEAEQEFWQHHQWKQQLQQLVNGCVWWWICSLGFDVSL